MRKAQGEGTTPRRVESLDNSTCRKADEAEEEEESTRVKTSARNVQYATCLKIILIKMASPCLTYLSPACSLTEIGHMYIHFTSSVVNTSYSRVFQNDHCLSRSDV